MGFGGLYTSVTGLMASRQSLDTVSHNISNANNPGYVRQSAIHANNGYTSLSGEKLQIGTGVNVSEIRQIRDEFLDKKIRNELASFGYHHAKSKILEDVEGVFNEITNSGLQKVMNDFWDNWDELSKDPQSLTIRALVHESSVAFTDTVNHIATQLDDIKQNLNKEIITKVKQVNGILEKVSSLNRKIKVVEGENSKVKANDFRDQRNNLLDQLSQLIPVKVYENKFGESVISLNGKDLVNSTFTNKIEIRTYNKDDIDAGKENTGLGYIYLENSNEKIELNGLGDLGGYIDARDNSIHQYQERLDELVGAMAEEINTLHKTGYNLEGIQENLDFFTGANGTINAGNIKVNPDLASFNKIAVSKNGFQGDGDIAKGIHAIRKEAVLFKYKTNTEKTMTTDEYYRDLLLALSIERESSKEIEKNQGFLINSIDERRSEISGVSLDEEMTEMIKFQHAYSANSRVINAIDEMIDQIVNRM